MNIEKLKNKSFPVSTFGTRYCEFDPIDIETKCPHCNSKISFEICSDDFMKGDISETSSTDIELECESCGQEFCLTLIASFSMKIKVEDKT